MSVICLVCLLCFTIIAGAERYRIHQVLTTSDPAGAVAAAFSNITSTMKNITSNRARSVAAARWLTGARLQMLIKQRIAYGRCASFVEPCHKMHIMQPPPTNRGLQRRFQAAPCNLLAAPGGSWRLLAAPGCSWLLLAAPGYSWLILAAPGCSWQLLAARSGFLAASWRLQAARESLEIVLQSRQESPGAAGSLPGAAGRPPHAAARSRRKAARRSSGTARSRQEQLALGCSERRHGFQNKHLVLRPLCATNKGHSFCCWELTAAYKTTTAAARNERMRCPT